MKHRLIRGNIILSVIFLTLVCGCRGKNVEELQREKWFSLDIGKMEDQLDFFQIENLPIYKMNHIYWRDPFFYIVNGNASKVIRRSYFFIV